MSLYPDAADQAFITRRIIDCCLREDSRGVVSQGRSCPLPEALHQLRALYDEASAAGALADRVPWAGDPREGGLSVHDVIMGVKANLEAGREALAGLS